MTRFAGRQAGRGTLVVSVIVSLICVWLAVRNVSLAGLGEALAEASPGYVGLALTAVLVASLSSAARWKLLYHPSHGSLSVGRLWRVLMISQALNIGSPVRLGEVARIVLMKARSQRSRVETLSTIGLEKLLDSVVLAGFLLVVSGSILVPRKTVPASSSYVAMATLLIVVVGVMAFRRWDATELLRRVFRRLPTWARREALREKLEVVSGRLNLLRRTAMLTRLLVWSALVWTASALANYLVFLSLGIEVPISAALVVLVALQLGTAVPSSPGRIGVFEYICVMSLMPFGVEENSALAYGLVLHAAAYGPPLLLGAIMLVREGGRKAWTDLSGPENGG